MNRTEQRFEQNVLVPRQLAGEIERWMFEPVKFRLGTDWKTTYTIDFMVFRADGQIELIDVKGGGGWEEHTRVKMKTAARLYPQFHWVGYSQKTAKSEFQREEF